MSGSTSYSSVFSSLKDHGYLCTADLNQLENVQNLSGSATEAPLLTLAYLNARDARSYAMGVYNLVLYTLIIGALGFLAYKSRKTK